MKQFSDINESQFVRIGRCKHPIRGTVLFCTMVTCLLFPFKTCRSAEPESAVRPVLTLLKSGRVPDSRRGHLIKVICDRGNEHDLRYIFDLIVHQKFLAEELQVQSLKHLADATTSRELKPHGDLSSIAILIQANNQQIQQMSIQLAGEWKVQETFQLLSAIASNPESNLLSQRNALVSMAKMAPLKTKPILLQRVKESETYEQQAMAIKALVEIDIHTAVKQAIPLLKKSGEQNNLTPLVESLLSLKDGSLAIANEIKETGIPPDAARRLLQIIYSIGRNDPELTQALTQAAKLPQTSEHTSELELRALVKDVLKYGDARRGERVFRRHDLSCLKCHSISKAGGNIGPELSAIGTNSPIEYLAVSILEPDQAIKEAYASRLILTTDGRIHHGLIANRTAETLVLKAANGKQTEIPLRRIETEESAKSLMPKGLAQLMTRNELIDLVKFLSKLGKPGEYEIPTAKRIQTWKLLAATPSDTPNLNSRNDTTVYSYVNGDLHIQELTSIAQKPEIEVQGILQVTTAGEITCHLNMTDGIQIRIDNQKLSPEKEIRRLFSKGIHRITLQIDSRLLTSDRLRVEFTTPEKSKAEFTVLNW